MEFKLPCKINDIVYVGHEDRGIRWTTPFEVIGFHFESDSNFFTSRCCRNYLIGLHITLGYTKLINIARIGDDVFLTKESADAWKQLKE